MKFLSNKISIVFICLMSFVISGLIFTDRVLGVTVKSNMDMYYGKIINLGTPTNSNDAATKNYVDSAFTGGSFSWSKLTGFPSACSSGQYVSGVGSSLTCSMPSSVWTSSGSNIYSNNSGYVGIGNSSPSYKLAVSGTINASNALCINGTCKNAWDSVTNYWTSSGSNIYSNNSGYVGIGNSSPSYKLDVSGTINALNAICISGTCKNTWNDPWSNLTNFPSSCSSGQYVSGVGSSLTCSTPSTPPSLWTDYGSYIYPNNYSSFVVTDSGYVGIGNSSPSYKLDVSGDTRLNGNVGIGTTPNSSYPLNVSGNSYLNGYVGIGTTPSTSYRLYVYGNSYLSGGVGIGTTPSSYYDLNVNNKVNAGGYLQNGTLTAPWFFSPTGNGVYPSNYSSTVFIGQSGAYTSDKLSVYGNVGVNGDIKAGSVKADYLNIYYNATISGNLTVNGSVNSVVKNFVINHPLDPENKKLIHSSLEGPEIAVFYRGEAQLQNGKAEVVLPAYFEALTRKDGRTVLLTPKFDSDELISQLAASAVENGKFKVKATDSQNPNQKFYWEVKAVRADIAPLEVERLKTENERKAESEK